MPALKLSFLGSPIFELDGEQLEISAGKSVALLAYLAVTGQIQSRDTLGTLLWPDKDQAQARTYLRHALWTLKKTVGERWLMAGREQIGLQFEAGIWLDVQAFNERISAVIQAPDSTAPLDQNALNQLQEAVHLYRDDFLAGFTLPDSPTFDEWQFFQAEALRQSYAAALERLVQEYSGQQAYAAAITNARRRLALDQLHEPAHRTLMRLYALDGQQAAALRQYQECARLLDEELGIEPEEESTSLYEAIRRRQLGPPETDTAIVEHTSEKAPQRFLIEKLLDKGAHGEVYLGQDTQTGKPVTIKRLRSDAVKTDETLLTRFLQEAEALQQLNHPNIVCMLDLFEQDGRPQMVMEYVPAGSLAQRLEQEKQLPLNEVLTIALELADALARAHHLNIIHRDIKPENVLLATDGSPRLIDFGVARLLNKAGNITDSRTLLGSPAYMSPEQLTDAETTPRSDIWSFGVLLFEMLAGQRPFPGKKITAVMANILNQPTPDIRQYRPDAPEALAQLIRALLAKAPEERIASMRLVAARLEFIRDNLAQPGIEALSTQMMPDIISVSTSAAQPLTQPAYFIGRNLEQNDLERSLQNPICRLITIMGPGGIGKTQMARAIGASVASDFPDGVFFVSLAPLQSTNDIITEIGNELGLQFSNPGVPVEQLFRFLNRKQLLLILDNFEHLISGAAIAARILGAAPAVKIIVTSRERLELSHEVVYPLAGLRFPGQERVTETDIRSYSAVQLLLERGQAIRPNLVIDAQSLPHIVRICRLVDGMPLALMIAASWLDLLSFEEIADEIEHSLDFLETEMRDVPDRQRSMRAVFDSSWQRLSLEEQQTLLSLSVFRGGFTREAVQSVAKSGPLILKKLVNKSLLVVDENGRFDLHELLRQYAQEQLQAAPDLAAETQARHANYFTTLFYNFDSHLKGDRQHIALKTIAAELENVRVTWRWLVKQQEWEKIIYQLLPALFRFCELRLKAVFLCSLIEEAVEALLKSEPANPGPTIAILQTAQSAFFYTGVLNRIKFENEPRIGQRESLVQAWNHRETLTGPHSLRWQVLLAFLYGQLVDVEAGIEVMGNLLPVIGRQKEDWDLAFAHQSMGHLLQLSKVDEAEAYLIKALDQFQKIGDMYETGITRYLLGLFSLDRQRLLEAQTHFLLGQQLFLREEDQAIFALINWNLADVYVGMGQKEKSIAILRQSYEILTGKGLMRSALAFLSRESYESLRAGNIQRAIEVGLECLSIVNDADDPLGEPWYNWELGEIYRVKGDLVQARHYYEQAHAMFLHNKEDYDPTFYHQGMAFYFRGLGNIALAQQDYEKAREYLQESLNMAEASDHLWITAYSSADLGRVLLLFNETETARYLLVRALTLAKQMANGGIAMIALAGVAKLYSVLERWSEAEQLGSQILNHPLTWWETKSQIAALLAVEAPTAASQDSDDDDAKWSWVDIVDDYLGRLS